MAEARLSAAVAGFASLAALGSLALPPAPQLIWNLSASTPRGLYRVMPGRPAAAGDWVALRTPLAVRALAARRRYLPSNVPLVKRVAAVSGTRACAAGRSVRVGNQAVARRARDAAGRPMPWWRGCRLLRPGELFVLGIAPDSFDGRYFGPVERSAVIGRAVPLWTR